MWLVNYKKLILWVTPQWLRNSNYLLLINAANYPIRQLHDRFINFKNAVLYRLEHNSQVCYLRKVLNDKCDNDLRRITITDFVGINGIFFYADDEVRDVNMGSDVFFYADDQYSDSGIDFIVNVPLGIMNSIDEQAYLKSLINQYKLAGKNYIIEKF